MEENRIEVELGRQHIKQSSTINILNVCHIMSYRIKINHSSYYVILYIFIILFYLVSCTMQLYMGGENLYGLL
jgi:hypothetical protein